MLKPIIENLDGLDEALVPYYAETDDGYVLKLEGIDSHPEISNLKNAYERTKADREAAKTEAQTLKAKIKELEATAPDTAATQAKISAMQEKLDEATAANQELSGKLNGVTRDRALEDAVTGAGISNPTYVKASIAMLKDGVKTGDDGTSYFETSMGPKLVNDYVNSWAATEGKAFVTPPKGGGAQGNDGGSQKTLSDMSESERLELARAGKLNKP